MAKTEQATEAPPKKGKKKLILIVLLVLFIGGGAGVYMFVLKKPAKPSTAKVVLHSVAYSMPMITTNLNDGHIVQAQMILELAPGDTKTEVTKDMAQLNNAAILAFGGMSYSQLLPTAGRTQAASTLQAAFNNVLHAGKKPWDTVDSILFSSFIVQ